MGILNKEDHNHNFKELYERNNQNQLEVDLPTIKPENKVKKRYIIIFIIGIIMIPFASYLINYLVYTSIEDFLTIDHQKSYIFIVIIMLIFGLYLYIDYIKKSLYKEKTGGRNLSKDKNRVVLSEKELREFYEKADLHMMDSKIFPQIDWRSVSGIPLGITEDKRTAMIYTMEEGHLFVCGSSGSSKTTGLAIPSALQFGYNDFAKTDGSVIAIDIKGDIFTAAHEKRKILRFCPDLKDPLTGDNIALQESAHFNILGNFKSMDYFSKKNFLENLSMTLIPDQGGSDGGYFTSRARKLLTGVIHYLVGLHPEITFPEILHAVLHPYVHSNDPNLERKYSSFYPSLKNNEYKNFPKDVFSWVEDISRSGNILAMEQVCSLIGNSEKNVSGAWDALCTPLVPFSNPILDQLLNDKGTRISMDYINQGYDLYLQISQENLDAMSPLFSCILASLLQECMSRPDASTGIKMRPILMILDELPQLHINYKFLSAALSTLRSKNIKLMLISQNLAQLAYKYPQESWRALIGNCQYQLILKSNEPTTQKYFSDLFGSRKTHQISSSKSGKTSNKYITRSSQESLEPVYHPEYFGDMGNKLVAYIDGKRIELIKIKSYEK